MCEILEDLKINFETHHDIYLPAGRPVLIYDIYIEFLLTKKTKKTKQNKKQQQQQQKKTPKKQAERNLMSTLQFRDVLDGISEACSMVVYFYI